MPFAALDDVTLHYSFEGAAGAPVVILGNSLGADLSMWRPQMPRLLRDFRVLRMDARGHGQSSVPAGPYTLDRLGQDVVALLDHFEIDTVRYCGLSMGGLVGIWLGLRAPSRLSHLALANTAAKIGTDELWNKRIEAVTKGGVAAIADSTLGRWFTPRFIAAHPTEAASMRRMFELTAATGYAGCCAAIRDADLRNDVSAIALPTLVIVGSHDVATSPEEGRYLAESVTSGTIVTLDAAHLSNVEAASAFDDALHAFWTN